MSDDLWLVLDSRGLGGIESHVAELAEGLAAAGERPRVVLLQEYGPHPLGARLAAACIPLDGVAGGTRGFLRHVRAAAPRVLHTHGYKANLVGRLAAVLTGTPHVATYHAGERLGGRLALYDRLDRWTSVLGGRIAVSRAIAQRMPFGATLVPNFVALPAAPQDGGTRVGFAGRLSHEKGPDRFVALARAVPEGRFVMFGDGPMAGALAAQAPGNLQSAGAVPGMAPHWRDLALLVIPSRAEGLPLAALEAMAHGVPVAAFAVGGLPDLIRHGENGFLLPDGDLAALTRAVRDFLMLPAWRRAELGRAARETVARSYGREAGVRAIRALYPQPRRRSSGGLLQVDMPHA